ncbi:MarR family winged helix-turn-helix transcriptional regulator [Actinocatenispora sera]|uniref:MarR family transcriptional regulator n=1 Tax=Actinocatenispora sera TaxID=390989 RepID=A0A810KY22_9ACTN|nr:MarR family transcriptional regulator [Actinocatenispora sera]BCJ27141.1 MarR family transcriptional regulator [Actinocatenispora sera]
MATVSERWNELHRLHTKVEAAVEAAVREQHGIGISEYAIMAVLAEHGHARMQRLAEAVELPQSTTSRLVARLESTGLLARYLCEADRRGVFTSITEAGRASHRAARKTYEKALATALGNARVQR